VWFTWRLPFKDKVLDAHLEEARDFARLLYVWFASFLKHTRDTAASQELALPARETLLKMIDLDVQDRGELETILGFMGQVPNNFPRIKEWLDDQL